LRIILQHIPTMSELYLHSRDSSNCLWVFYEITNNKWGWICESESQKRIVGVKKHFIDFLSCWANATHHGFVGALTVGPIQVCGCMANLIDFGIQLETEGQQGNGVFKIVNSEVI